MDFLISKAEALIEQESKCELKRQQRIEERREEFRADNKVFEAELAVKRNEIEESFKAKEEDVIDYYIQLEKNLKLDYYNNTRHD